MAHDQLFFLPEFPLDSCRFVGLPSLTRGRVCNLLLLLGLTSTVPLVSEYCGTQDHILLSQLRLPEHGGPVSRIQVEGDTVIPPGTGFPFCHLL
jgi:hypothetical protein